MEDRLVWLLRFFHLRARVFQAGPLCRTADYDAQDGLGYIHLLRGGTLKVETIGQPSLLLDEPSLVFYMNPTSHRLLPQDNRVDMVCGSFEFGHSMRNPLSQAIPDVLLLQLKDTPALNTCLSLLFCEAQIQHCGRQAVLDRLIEVVIIQLLRDLMDQNRLQIGLLAGLADPKLAKAINAMHAEPSRDWTLESLATVAGMSRARFATKFRDTVGMTPGSYLAEWRIGIAQSLLCCGKSVQFVADAVGYGSASAMSRAFVTHVGITPSDWRKQYTSDTHS